MKKRTQIALDNSIIDDWTFKNADTQEHIHGIHPYPARMVPQVAKKLIENYSKPYDVVLDPFCGSGGVLTEAKILKTIRDVSLIKSGEYKLCRMRAKTNFIHQP
ncbi:MAG: DNA methyltransferase [Candidatus Methanospirareceae archaeon]